MDVRSSRTAVVLVNYNNVEDTANCVSSLMPSAEKPYLVVVDNSGQKPSIEKIIKTYPDATLISSKNNIGFGRANNLAIRHILRNTDCEFFFLLNNDATIEQNTIRLLEKAMDTHPEAGVVSPRILLMENPNLLWYGGGDVDWYRGKGKVPGYLGPADSRVADTSRDVRFVSGCAMFIRRIVLQQVGGFDPRFFMYDEDLELCLRIQEAGWRLWYLSEAKVLHKGQGSQNKRGSEFLPLRHPRNPNLPFFLYNMTKNRLLNMDMHARGSHLLRFWVGFPIFLALDCARYSMAGRWSVIRDVINGIASYFRLRGEDVLNELDEDYLAC